MSAEFVLSVQNLSIQMKTEDGIISIVDQVSFSVNKGEIFSLVGESGCGKTMTALAITKLLPYQTTTYPTGVVYFKNTDILQTKPEDLRSIRGTGIAYIFQEPFSSLNPLQKIGEQLIEGFLLHKLGTVEDAKAKAIRLLERVGITDPKTRLEHYPNQFSGGMLQRVCIAMALMCDPQLLIADEPTSAIDVTIQVQLVQLLKDLQKEKGMGILFISHDIGLVSQIADRIGVMYAGKLIEVGTVEDIIETPSHPYTKALVSAYPSENNLGKKLITIDGIVPIPKNYPIGCRFRDRCQSKKEVCSQEPPVISISQTQFSLCHFAKESL